MFALRDGSGISESVVAVSREALQVAALMDGSLSLAEIHAESVRRLGDGIPFERIEELAGSLEKALLLDSERFRARRRGRSGVDERRGRPLSCPVPLSPPAGDPT
jgi:hypothetical protein